MWLLNCILPGKVCRRKQLAATQPVVIMSRGHSGTRVLSWIVTYLGLRLGTNENLASGDAEDERFTNRIKAIALRNLGVTSVAGIHRADLDEFQWAVARYHRGLGSPSSQWGWKFPETYLIGPYLAATFPEIQYIHMVRDGRDVAFKEHLTDNMRRPIGRRILTVCGAMDLPHHLQAASSWAYQVDNFDRFRAHIPAAQVFNLTFEELCQHPLPIVERLCAFLGVPMTPQCQEFCQQKIDTGKIAEYRQQDPRLVKEIELRVGPTLRRYGYLPPPNAPMC